VNDREKALLDDAQQVYGSRFRARARNVGDAWVVDLIKIDGSVIWPDYATGPSELLAVLAGEQRYRVEESGEASLSGDTYVEKAQDRLRRWLEG